jgi:hypothetical protein
VRPHRGRSASDNVARASCSPESPQSQAPAMNQSILFLDLRALDGPTPRKIHHAVEGVLRHRQFIVGPDLQELEDLLGRHCARRYAVRKNSRTAPLSLVLKGIGVQPRRDVIMTSLLHRYCQRDPSPRSHSSDRRHRGRSEHRPDFGAATPHKPDRGRWALHAALAQFH